MRYIRLFKNLANWWLYILVKFGLTRVDPLIFRTRNNIVIEVPRRLLHEFKEIFMEDSYTRGVELIVPGNSTVIDIGANAGFFSLFAAYRFPGSRIFSYEPVASNFIQLERNKVLNEDVEIMCFQKAVYGHSGEVSLSFDPNDSFTASASVFNNPGVQNKTVRVPCVTLQEIFDEHHLECCDLLKIDCEGAEYEILYNCPVNYLHRVAQMAIEVHVGTGPNQNIESLANYLNAKDYKTRLYADHMLWAWRQN